MLSRLEQLTPETKPLWGKMNVVGMLNHLNKGMGMANGTLNLKRSIPGLLFGRFALAQYTNDKPFSQNLPTDPNLKPADKIEFEAEKTKLIQLVKDFQAKGEAGVSKHPHPFFGKLEPWQWGRGMWKHNDHHFRQFGV